MHQVTGVWSHTMLCSERAVSLVRTKMIVCPSFSQFGNIISFSTFCLSGTVGHLTRHCLITSRLSCSLWRNTCGHKTSCRPHVFKHLMTYMQDGERTMDSACNTGAVALVIWLEYFDVSTCFYLNKVCSLCHPKA